MSQSRIAIISLAVLLVASNALWAYPLVFPGTPESKPEYGCSASEQRVELERQIVWPLTAAIAASAAPGATKQSVVAAANKGTYGFCIRDSDVIIAKRVALRFDDDGKLVGASTTICSH